MSLGSKYIIMKNFNKRLIKFKNKDKYDNGGELNGVENKNLTINILK